MSLPKLNSLWVGKSLGYLERLCLASARQTGHDFTLWSYKPNELQGVPEYIEVRDASEVMPYEQLLRYKDTGSVALGANLWRIQLLSKGLGYWVDMDFIFLKPLDFKRTHVFGWEYEGWINNAVLLAPSDSAMVKDLITIPQPNRRPPWFGPKRTLQYYCRRIKEGHIGIDDMPWGTYSSGLITHCVKKNRLENSALPPSVFYPIRWKDARSLYGSAAKVEAQLSDDTRAVHMWHSRLNGLKDAPPVHGSYIDRMCRRHDVEINLQL